MLIVGIDPGLRGGIAFMDEASHQIIDLQPMPTKLGARGKKAIDPCAVWDMLAVNPADQYALVVVELVGADPKWGKATIWSFAEGVGRLLAALELARYPIERPTPQLWKKTILEGTDKSKEAAIGYVQGRFPGVDLFRQKETKPEEKESKPCDGLAEAVCMAEYGFRKLSGG